MSIKMSKDRMSGPEWKGWENLKKPQKFEWRESGGMSDSWYSECLIGDKVLAVLEKRSYYCDRGHWSVKSFLPDLDHADGFPRYYMRGDVAIKETEAWLAWRLWGEY